MSRSIFPAVSALVVSGFALGGCRGLLGCGEEHRHARADAAWAAVTQAVAVLAPTEGSAARGTVRFTRDGAKVRIVADVEGLNPNQKHAIHVHEWGDITAKDGMATGSHYNPEGHEHGLIDKEKRHAGDLGNLTADASGKAHYEIVVDNLSVAAGKNPILGRAVIVHAKEDDGGQPLGNAGGRIAQGVVGIVKPAG
jgi:Cu-Zn family superoxide dismutase